MANPLNDIDTLDLLNKIQEFKQMDLKKASMKEISNKFLDMVSCIVVTSYTFPETTRLYRIRKLKPDFSNIPRVFQDIWYPTPDMVIADGRANVKGQPMLYCSTEEMTPLYECKIKENDCYVMIQYSVKLGKNLIGYGIGSIQEPLDLDERGKINNKIINEFISTEFGKPVGLGTEYHYKVSNVICRDLMDMPSCDAYVYASIANAENGWNIAIKPKPVMDKIKFDGALVCVSKGFDAEGNYQFEVKHQANQLEGDKLVYIF